MVQSIKNQFINIGLVEGFSLFLALVSLAIFVTLLCWLSDFVARKYILGALKKIVRRTTSKWDDIALRKKVFHRLAHLAPAIILFLFAPVFILEEYPITEKIAHLLRLGTELYMVFLIVMVINSLLNTVVQVYRNFEVAKQRPIKSYVQVVKILIFLLAGIFTISIVIQRSPWALLTGLGAMTAILLLIFKDSILGLVASVQISTQDTFRMGDWIEMPKYGADGEVIDMSLTNIKIQNWDKTITTIPTHALLSDPVKNWRGMSDSGGRRIKRHINIDMNSVKFCDAEMLKRFSQIQHISNYIEEKKIELKKYNHDKNFDNSSLVNGRRMTNLGTFRAYIEAYLKNHPKIHQSMTFLVRHLQPNELGLPIEIYVFSNDQVWANYEAIQADIFDHILAVVPLFDLRVFQRSSDQLLLKTSQV